MKTNIEEIVKKYLEIYPEEKEKLEDLNVLIKDNKNNYDNLFNRKNFKGHITASGYIYCKEEKKLLLLEHKTLKKFLQPGGHVELYDDEMINSAQREIEEETGIKNLNIVNVAVDVNIPIDINTHYIPKSEKKNEEEHYHHDFRYLFLVNNIKDIKIDFNESNGYKWIDIEKIKNNTNFIGIADKILNF